FLHDDTHNLRIGYNGVDMVTVRSNSNVGIGTTTPWGQLSITNISTNPSFVVEDSASPDSSPFLIDASGNVGIGTTSPFTKLSVQGNGYLSGDLTAANIIATGTLTAANFSISG